MSDPSGKGPDRENVAITVHSVVEVTVRSVRTVTAYLTEKTASSALANELVIRRPVEPTLRTVWNAPALKRPGMVALMLIQRARRLAWLKSARSIDLTAVVAVLALACFTAYIDRHAASAQDRIPLQSIASTESPATPAAVVPASVMPASVMPASVAIPVKRASLHTRTRGRKRHFISRARHPEVTEGRVVHIGNDVTVRYFGSTRTVRRAAAKRDRIAGKGSDITVRYFNPDGSVRKTADSPKGADFGANALSELRTSETKTPN